MSSALVKRSLQLFEEDLKTNEGSSSKKKKMMMSDDPMSLISTNRKGVKKELRKLQRNNKKNQAGTKQTWSALELYDYNQSVDYTEASVKALQRISLTNKKDHSTAQVILGHHQTKVSRKKKTPKKESNQDSTAFTDEDFKKFEKEFFS